MELKVKYGILMHNFAVSPRKPDQEIYSLAAVFMSL